MKRGGAYRDLRLGDKVSGGRFQLESILGRGAFGEVFLGVDTKLGRRVAIKHLTYAAWENDDAWNRFWQEAQILSRLEHPNIVRIYDFDQNDAILVLEFAARGTLESKIARDRRLAAHDAVELIADVLAGLKPVHERCVWHRDLKPANILLADDGRVMVSDFGIAHAPSGSDFKLAHTHFGQPGTPLYMSPEQIRGEPIDGRSDIYAVGAILYQLLTGTLHLPFWTLEGLEGHVAMAKLKEMIVGQRPRPPSQLNPTVPRGLSDIVLRAMTVDAQKRFLSVAEFEATLRQFLRGSNAPEAPAPAAPLDETPLDNLRAPPPKPQESPQAVEVKKPHPAPAKPPPVPPVPVTPPRAEAPLSPADQAAVDQARAALSERNYDLAVALLSPIARARPAWAVVHPLSDAYLASRRYQPVLDLIAALPGTDLPSERWALEGACHARLGHRTKAVAALRAGCDVHKGDAALREKLAVALHEAGQVEDAISAATAALALDPARATVKRLLRAWRGR
jgi:serine/threonine protein kinase